MPSVTELQIKYQTYSNQVIMEMYGMAGTLSEEGNEALLSVIEKRGGIEVLRAEMNNDALYENEKAKLRNEIRKLRKARKYPDEIIHSISSTILTNDELRDLIITTVKEPKIIFGLLAIYFEAIFLYLFQIISFIIFINNGPFIFWTIIIFGLLPSGVIGLVLALRGLSRSRQLEKGLNEAVGGVLIVVGLLMMLCGVLAVMLGYAVSGG